MSPIEKRKSDHAILIQFALEQAESAPVRVRVPVYRAIANLLGDTRQASNLNALANSLENADHQAREFTFHIDNPKPSTR